MIWTRLHASAISSDIWRSGCVTSVIFGMACVIVIERKWLSCSSEVTLFRCVSLWEYNGIFFYLVPFHQPISAHAISSPNCHWNVSLPSGASPWMAFLAWSKGQNITIWWPAQGVNTCSLQLSFCVYLPSALVRAFFLCGLSALQRAFFSISSSSYRAGSTDIPDPLSPLLPIVHRPR